MGAAFNFITYSNLPADMLKTRFAQLQEQDRYENGHSYSGGFGMAPGLRLHSTLEPFPTKDAAYDYLESHAQKWEDAIGVRYLTESDVEGGQLVRWAIGAWCSE
jgi:hypothetical protein